MVSLRESLVVHHEGLAGLIRGTGSGVHPPLLDLLSSAASPCSARSRGRGGLNLGEKLYSPGLRPRAYAGALPGVRPRRCVPLAQLAADAASGPQRIALVRTPEDEAPGRALPLSGPAIVVVRDADGGRARWIARAGGVTSRILE